MPKYRTLGAVAGRLQLEVDGLHGQTSISLPFKRSYVSCLEGFRVAFGLLDLVKRKLHRFTSVISLHKKDRKRIRKQRFFLTKMYVVFVYLVLSEDVCDLSPVRYSIRKKKITSEKINKCTDVISTYTTYKWTQACKKKKTAAAHEV